MKTYEFKIKIRDVLKNKIENQLGCTRLVYNLALETKEESFKKGVKLSKFDLIKQLPELKKEFKWLSNVHSQTLQGTIERLDKGYEKFFSDLKKGITTSKPKFAKKKKWSSVEYKSSAVRYGGNSEISISKIGRIKFFKSREIEGEIKIVRIVKKADGYYLNIVTDKDFDKCDNQATVGIDVGIKYFFVTSDGEYFENIKTLKRFQEKLRIENRKLSRKKKFSNNFYKQVERIKLLHLKISRVRKDYLHKVSSKLAESYSTIVCEDLNISKMIQQKGFSKDISDVSWSTFMEMLSYKTNLVKVDAKYSSQECNACGHISKENRLTQELFKCVKCGHSGNSDHEASITILNRGI